MKTTDLEYTGKSNLEAQNPHPDAPKTAEPYIAPKSLKKAVNLAIFLRRPLLLEGEAGCGKTRLARAVAYELGLPFYRWNIRSTTKAQEGLYTYDAILRLHDVQILEKTKQQSKKGKRNPENPEDYVKFGAIGKAFQVEDCPAVVLIDEIDKAELDFPNDLLTVLDKPWQFEIPEIERMQEKVDIEQPQEKEFKVIYKPEVIKARHQPIVIITSNKEKGNLPAPFLRRCLYYFLKFPDTERELEDIVKIHYPQWFKVQEEEDSSISQIVKGAIKLFLDIRQEGLFKKPGTSEFLDWLRALVDFEAKSSLDGVSLASLPYRELLFKIRTDWDKFEESRV